MQHADERSPSTIIVGLGNPGTEYDRHRHNIGFMVLNALAREHSGRWESGTLSRVCRVDIGNSPVLLVEPMTYMNRSGRAVQAVLSEYQRGPQDLLVIMDDLNLPFGRIRIRERGSAGGHNGLDSILSTLGTEEVLRIRMGIGEEEMPDDKAEFVLSEFPPERQEDLEAMIGKAGNAVRSILTDGVSRTMAIFNA